MSKIYFSIVLCLVGFSSFSQSKLNAYVSFGIENNLALQQKQVNYEIANQALKEARGLFFPEVTMNARYTVATGGRVIDFPIGDLINPVYSSLNQLMELPTSDQFPMLNNE